MQPEQAVELWRAGTSTTKIAVAANCDPTTVRRWIRLTGVRMDHPHYTSPAQAEKVIELYKAGHTNRVIAKMIGRHHGTVMRIILRFRAGKPLTRAPRIKSVKRDPARTTDADLMKMWNEGIFVADIAERAGLAPVTVRRHARRLGLKPRTNHKPITEADKAMILMLHKRGMTLCEIGRTMDRRHQFIADWLKKISNPVAPTQDAPTRVLAHDESISNGLPVSLQAGPVACPPSPHMSSGRITPEVSLRAAQTTHLRKTAKPRGVPIGPPPKHCQYPEGEKPYTFCLKPVAPERPYCAEHTARCYVKLKPSH